MGEVFALVDCECHIKMLSFLSSWLITTFQEAFPTREGFFLPEEFHRRFWWDVYHWLSGLDPGSRPEGHSAWRCFQPDSVLSGFAGLMGSAPLANLWFRQLLKADCQTGLTRNVFVKLGEKRKQCYLERVNLNGFHSTNGQAFRKQPEPKQEKWATL